jgi:predicted ATPase
MINSVEVKNFKSLVDEKFEFKNLTLLTGTNSSGKSSTIHALLLFVLEVTKEYNSALATYLNFLRKDKNALLNFHSTSKAFSIAVDNKAKLFYEKGERSFTVEGEVKKLEELLSYQNERLTYLCADRIGTREFYLKNDTPEFDKIGIYGEYAMDYFEYQKNKPIVEALMIDKNNPTLEVNVNYWLNRIVKTELKTEDGGDDIKAFFAYKTDEVSKPKFVNPKNIGSGTGYLISMIIACLSAKRENIVIIENPEIHLHPNAQAKLAEFFAFIASRGVQLIIETHNDHLLNRFRYEVYKGYLHQDEIVVYYKDSTESFEKIEILENGKFNNQENENSFPKGFYDATLQEIYQINRGV